ncbi:semaphorin-4B-like isoform X2 [Halichondria panicea]|uniref:semaphorin-4B-like isoform X2 n=1 Tax=Halichondria panicea TaxID=6063 RepID=UPI00312BA461
MVNSADQTRTCQNHIRLYKAIPMETNLVLVCGTEASISPPQCRTIDVSSNTLTAVQGPVDAANAIVSYSPEFEGFGEFIRNDTTAYFGVGFYQGDRGVGRDYQMAFYNVQSPSNGPLSVVTNIITRVHESWLKSPVTFVDYYRADYLPPTVEVLSVSGGTPRPEDYHFYFVFIRENTASGTEVIHSQVVRICRNDPGVNGFFSTYMKARIYCMMFIGANDYIYNNIDSVAFNEGGRHGEGETWQKTMYGAFSGPLIGPEGSAVCVYPAENSRETDAMASFNQGIFDIFREDLLTTDGVEKQNVYVECDPAGRIEAASLYVDIIHNIEQMGNNPLLFLEGITVTKMVVDSVCVVRSSDSTQCVNQDVLILGTDDMKVMKVVFATVTAGQTTPVYSEIISLGSGNSSEDIQALRIEEVGSEKKIFVSTQSEVYQLPIERCSRFTSCSTCVGARDPHCVWHAGNNACERNPLSAVGSATGTVPPGIWQDIHDGIAPDCTSTTRFCETGGIWVNTGPTDPPTTNSPPTTCPDLLPVLNNGIIMYSAGSPDSRPFGSTAMHSCNTGYTLNGGTATRTCVTERRWSGSAPTCQPLRCLVGTYQEELSTGESACVPCPGNSVSIVEDSVECTCFRGYYRTALEGPNIPCSIPPNNCKSLQVVAGRTRGNTITVRWERPEITGRDDLYYNIFYSEDNQTFTQHNSRPYVKQDSLVDYSVSGLQPLTSYTIRVIPENGVSNQEEGGQSRSCEVFAMTGDIRSNAPSLVIGFCTVVVWTTPIRSYGRITGYDVRFIPQGSGSDLMVSKGRRELFHAVGDTGLVTTDNVMVQVRAKTSAAEGRWSELVPLGCRNADGFTGPL